MHKMFILYIGVHTHTGIRHETFYYPFEFKVFRHEERETQFLTMLTFPSETHHVRYPAANYWSGLGELRKINFLPLGSNLNALFFFKSPNHQSIASGHDDFHIPSPIFYLGFLLWHLWLLHPPRAHVNTCT